MRFEDTGPTTLARRSVLRLLIGGASATLLAACAPAGPGPSAPGPAQVQPAGTPGAAPKPAQAQPKPGGTLRVVTSTDLSNLNPHTISPVAFDTMWSVFDPLTRYDAQLKPQRMLAESWDVSTDLKRIQLNLRKNVTFHTGRELTSEDVKWNIERVKDPKAQALQLVNMGNWWSTIETPDKYSVVLTSEVARPAMFDMLEYLNIVDRVTMEGPDGDKKLVGTGPFTWGEWSQGNHQRYPKNKNYWQSGKPYVDELFVQVSKDVPAAVVQLEAGAVDAILNAPVREVSRLQKDANFKVLINENTGQYFILSFNTTMPPFDNKQVRQALNFAVDRKRFVDTVLIGSGEPRNLPWARQSPAFDAAKNSIYSYDPDKAKALLAQAGNPLIDTEINYSTSDAEPGQLAQMLQSSYLGVGAKTTLKPLETAVLQDLFNRTAYKGMSLRFSGFAGTDPATLFTVGTYYRLNTNASGFKSDRYEQLVRAAGSEPDTAKRKQVFADLNDLLLDESFVAIISTQTVSVTTQSAVSGIVHSMHEAVLWTDAWKA
jgi:peptide/nickel transport system substrate-binding protein